MTGLTALLAALGTLGSLGGLGSLLTVRATRRRIVAESQQIKASADESIAGTVKVLLGGAADLVQPLQRQLDQAEARADRLDTRLAQARRDAEELSVRLHRLVAAIRDPYITLDRLRAIVPADPDADGR